MQSAGRHPIRFTGKLQRQITDVLQFFAESRNFPGPAICQGLETTMAPRLSISRVIVFTAVLAPTAALCCTAPVPEYAYGLWSGSHVPNGAEFLLRLIWAWPLVAAITWLAIQTFERRRIESAGLELDPFAERDSTV